MNSERYIIVNCPPSNPCGREYNSDNILQIEILKALLMIMVDLVRKRTFTFFLFFHLPSAMSSNALQTENLGHGRGKIINITLVKFQSFFSNFEYIFSFPAEESRFPRGGKFRES